LKQYNIIENTSKIYYNGSKWNSNGCGEFEIIGKTDRSRLNGKGSLFYPYCLCQFKDKTIIEADYGAIKAGRVKNPNYPTVYDIGYVGQGKWNPTINRQKTREYSIWSDMIQRCYSEKCQEKHPTYKGCVVDVRWHCFQTFCDDIQELENYKQWKEGVDNWELDKDTKIKGNKLYSKDTCAFILQTKNMNEMNQRTISNKLTGLIYIGVSPNGDRYEFTNQHEFAKYHNLNSKHVNSCILGKLKSYKKWTFKIKK
jgi:hypothetical protein